MLDPTAPTIPPSSTLPVTDHATQAVARQCPARALHSLLHFKRKVWLHRLFLAWRGTVVANRGAANHNMLQQLKVR